MSSLLPISLALQNTIGTRNMAKIMSDISSMEKTLKIIGFATLALAALGFVILSMMDLTTVPLPIDQSQCPPDVELAKDGTCGIYAGVKASAGAWIAIAVGSVGAVSLVGSYLVARKNTIRE